MRGALALLTGCFLLVFAGPLSAAERDCGSDRPLVSAILDVSLCVDPSLWVDSEKFNQQEFSLRTAKGDAGLAVIPEQLELTPEVLRQAILANASTAAGVSLEDIVIVRELELPLGGVPGSFIQYRVAVQGLELEFFNYYHAAPGFGSLQVVFWTLPTLVDSVKPLIKQVSSTVAVGTGPAVSGLP